MTTHRFPARAQFTAPVADFATHPGRHCKNINTDLFFTTEEGARGAAKKICKGCPVATACLQYAFDVGERWGIWAGVLFSSAEERRRAQRKLAAEARVAA